MGLTSSNAPATAHASHRAYSLEAEIQPVQIVRRQLHHRTLQPCLTAGTTRSVTRCRPARLESSGARAARGARWRSRLGGRTFPPPHRTAIAAFLCARPKPTVKSSRQYVGEIPYSSAAPCLATQLSHSLTPCLNQIARHQQGKLGKVNWTLISVVATMTTAPCLGTSMPSPDLDKLGCRHDARKARLWLGHDAREALRLRRLLIDSVGLPA